MQLNDFKQQQIVDAFLKDGKSPKEIAEMQDIPVSKVYYYLKRANIDVKCKMHAKDSAIINDYKNGMSVHELADKYNQFPSNIWKILKRNNVKLIKVKKAPTDNQVNTYNLILSLKVLGYSQSDIAKELGVSRQYISKIIARCQEGQDNDKGRV